MNDKNIPKLRFPEFDDEWEQRKVGEYCNMFNGDRSAKYPGAQDMVADGIPFINAGDLENGRVNLANANKITRDKYDNLGGAKLQLGDIVYCLRGTLGKNAYIDNFNEGTVASSLVAIRPKNIDGRYLFHVLNSDIEYRQRIVHDESAAQPNLSAKSVAEFTISVPDFEEQKKISSYFDSLGNLITLHQRRCDGLKELRDGLIQRILSRKLRFKREDGSEFENWVTKELSEIFTERKVSQTITDDAPLLSFTIEQGVISPKDKKTNKRDFLIKDKDTKKFALTEVDDIIYNPANLKYGAIHRNKLMRGVVSPIYAIFYTEQNPAFMEYVVKSPTFIKNSMKYLEGTVIKLMTLKPRDFLKLKVEIPASLEEQKIIADFLMLFDETIDAEQSRIEKWKELKQGLLQQMFV